MEQERDVMEVDVLFVGGGVAGLSGALHLANLIKKHGFYGMSENISKTAQFGMLKTKGKIINKTVTKSLDKIFNHIKTGKFAKEWQNEFKNNLSKDFCLSESDGFPYLTSISMVL